MTALPPIGGDYGQWGTDLNAFALVSHNSDGTLKVSGGAGTPGSVLYWSGAHGVTQDNAHLYYDATHHRWHIGGNSPTTTLHVTGTVRHQGMQQGFMAFDPSGYMFGIGPWTAYTPVLTPDSGALTTFTSSGRYFIAGKTVFLQIYITITNAGSASGGLQFSLPPGTAVVSGADGQMVGREFGVSGSLLSTHLASSTTFRMLTYAAGGVCVNGYLMVIGGRFRTQ